MTHAFPTRRSSDLARAMLLHMGDRRVLPNTGWRRAAGPLRPREKTVTMPLRAARPSQLDVASAAFAATLINAMEAKRSEEHTSELQSLMRISYAVFC